MAQFGAGRGKLPQAILYPWPLSGSSELCQLVVWAIPYLWPQSSNSVNSSIGIVSPLLECQCQASALTHFPMTLFAFLNLCTALRPSLRVIPIPIYQGQSLKTCTTGAQYLSQADAVSQTGVWKQIWGRDHPLSCDRHPDGLVRDPWPISVSSPHLSALLVLWPVLYSSSMLFGASGVLPPRSGHCSTLAWLLTS